MGFNRFFDTFQNIKKKRNSFIHTGRTHKTLEKKIGTFSIPSEVQLDESDTMEAVGFAEDTVHFFAKLYTEYGKWQPLYEEY